MASDGYVAMVQHYFASAWLLGDGIEREHFVRKVGKPTCTRRRHDHPVGIVTPRPVQGRGSRLFVGPQAEKVLEGLAPAWSWSKTTAG